MEDQLFEYDSWDVSDTFVFVFYDVKLKIPIGPHPAGTTFPMAMLDYEHSQLQLYNDSESQEHETYDLTLQVGARNVDNTDD